MKNILLITLVFITTTNLWAGVRTVTNENDTGAGSFRQVIADAAPGDTILFTGLDTVRLASTITINKSLAIYGGDAGVVLSRAQGGAEFRIMKVEENVPVFIGFVTFHNGIVRGESGVGGGLYNRSNNLVLYKCGFVGNRAIFGGGMYNISCSPTIVSCWFERNAAILDGRRYGNNDGCGGAMYNSDSKADLRFCHFIGNVSAANGGGIFNNSASPVISSCVFMSNHASTNGGGMSNSLTSNTKIYNSLIAGNTADGLGGGIDNVGSRGVVLTNVTMAANNARNGGAINNTSSLSRILNSIIYNNGSGIYSTGGSFVSQNSLIQEVAATDNGNIDGRTDPLFISPVPPGLSKAGNYRLQVCSPVINKGNNGLVGPVGVTTDLDSSSRIYEDPNFKIVDMGAYEHQAVSGWLPVLYVDSSMATSGDGSSWKTAFKTLQEAIDVLDRINCVLHQEIWVKKGTYVPSAYPSNCVGCVSPTDFSFKLRGGVFIYGGFAGTETSLTQRTPEVIAANPSTLSGDIKMDDAADSSNYTDNVYHVVMAVNNGRMSRLDGFSVVGGYADGTDSVSVDSQFVHRNRGGGLNATQAVINTSFCSFSRNSAVQGGANANTVSVVVVDSCTYHGNWAGEVGGAQYNSLTTITASRSLFTSNTSRNEGGAVFAEGGKLSVFGTEFAGNSSTVAGAIKTTEAGFTAFKNVFYRNVASRTQGGALFLSMGSEKDSIINNLFIGNAALGLYSADGGGAILQENGSGTFIANNTFYSDTALASNSAIHFKGGGSERYLYNNIFYKNHSYLPGYKEVGAATGTTITGEGNNLYKETDPLFVNEANPRGPDGKFGTADDGLSVNLFSPAINTGENSRVPPSIATDFAGTSRILQGTVDIGAYEFAGVFTQVVFVDSSIAISGIGNSWAQAVKTVQEALALADTFNAVRQIWVKKGTYTPSAYPAGCNGCNSARDFTFKIHDGLALYGGFAGTENTLAERTVNNIASNPTILSGDLAGDDSTNFAHNEENVHHIITALNGNTGLLIDGFTVGGGNANIDSNIYIGTDSLSKGRGAGIISVKAKLTLSHCILKGNAAIIGGAFANITNGSNAFNNCTFSNNKATADGGGFYAVSTTTVERCKFFINTASNGEGGAIQAIGAMLDINRSLFQGNIAKTGGAVKLMGRPASFKANANVFTKNESGSNNGGALHITLGTGEGLVVNNLFMKNRAYGIAGSDTYGGASLVLDGGSSSQVANNTFYADTSLTFASSLVFKNSGANRSYFNNIFSRSYNGYVSAEVEVADNAPIAAGNNIFSDTDPLFQNEDNLAGADSILGTADDGLVPTACSPAVNMGSNNNIPPDISTDLTGDSRVYENPVDMGAYEVHTRPAMTDTNMVVRKFIQKYSRISFSTNCSLLASLQSGGTEAVEDVVTARVWVTPSQFAPVRHYEIMPRNEIGKDQTLHFRIKGYVTLYYTQQDFDTFNANLPQWLTPRLPTGPTDKKGKEHVGLNEYYGASYDSSGSIGSYGDKNTAIHVDPENVLWNPVLNRWELTFGVTGWGGFYLGINSGLGELPIQLLSFTGQQKNGKTNLQWQTTGEENTSHFIVEKSTDGIHFSSIGKLLSQGNGNHAYSFTDAQLTTGHAYYRLTTVDKDGKTAYSNIINIRYRASGIVQLYPQPANNFVMLQASTMGLLNTKAILIDMHGRQIKQININQLPFRLGLTGLPNGMYHIKLASGEVLKMMKQ